jgi:lipoate-protein ligase A
VDALTCRLLPYATADGPHNMATDEALLQTAVRGGASLRFYGWSPATLSLGYFQPEAVRHEDARLAALPWVRRPSGGGTLVHQHEVTYALALPPGEAWQGGRSGQSWLRHVHDIIAAAMADLGVAARLHVPSPGEEQCSGCLCFRQFAPGDLLIGAAKVVGSAQRRHRGALLQHGVMLLAQSPSTPTLPGIAELTGRRLDTAEVCTAVAERFREATGWGLEPGQVAPEEERCAAALVAEKYTSEDWNRKR